MGDPQGSDLPPIEPEILWRCVSDLGTGTGRDPGVELYGEPVVSDASDTESLGPVGTPSNPGRS